MLLLRKHIVLSTFLAALAFIPKAGAGLYGYTNVNPYTREEELLDIEVPPLTITNYREKMRDNLLMLIDYAKSQKPDFKIIAHEGQELLTKSLWEYHLEGYNAARRQGINASDPSFLTRLKEQSPAAEPAVGTPGRRYLNALDAIVLNNLYCTPQHRPGSLLLKHKLPILSIEQCADELSFDKAIVQSVLDKRVIYGFDNPQYAFRDIKHLPVINETAKNVMSVNDAKNMLILTDESEYQDKYEFIDAIRNTNYDIVIIQPLFKRNQTYTPEEIASLQYKKNGTKRLLIAQMNVSEANGRDYFWQKDWQVGYPSWLVRLSFVDEDSVIAKYWAVEWQRIIARHFKSIVDSGFDGVFFTGLENHLYFEKQTPLE